MNEDKSNVLIVSILATAVIGIASAISHCQISKKAESYADTMVWRCGIACANRNDPCVAKCVQAAMGCAPGGVAP